MNFLFSCQASNKFKRWNDYYESMDPKKKDPTKKPEIDVTRSATVRYLSVYPRKRNETNSARGRITPAVGAQTMPHSSNQQRTATADQPIVPTERYTSRPHEYGPSLNRSGDAGQTNYAWVD